MVKIRIPNSVKVVLTVQGPTGLVNETHDLQFVRDFLNGTVLKDPKWGKDSDMLHAAFDIRQLFRGAEPEMEVELSTDLHKKLVDVVKSPTNGYNPSVLLDAISFLDAIEKAA